MALVRQSPLTEILGQQARARFQVFLNAEFDGVSSDYGQIARHQTNGVCRPHLRVRHRRSRWNNRMATSRQLLSLGSNICSAAMRVRGDIGI